MNKEALFCDGTEAYVSQPEPEVDEWIQLWFRTAKDDVDEVLMCIKDESFPMKKMISKGAFDYYCIDWQLDTEEFRYYFKILKGEEVCYYNQWGLVYTRSMISPVRTWNVSGCRASGI